MNPSAVPAYLPLPVRPEQITAPWLSAALADRHPAVVVEEARVEDILWGTSTKIRVRLRCNAAGQAADVPPTLIVKGGFEEHSPQMAYMYASEMRYYRDLAPRMSLNVPRCWFAASDPGSHQSIVVMDDLVPRGVRFCRVQQPHTLAEASAFVDALAQCHAPWWGRPELDDGGELGWVMHPFDEPSWGYYNRYLEPERWQHYMAQPRGMAVPQVFHDGERMRRMLQGVQHFHAGGVRTLTHGDTHPGNLYIEADGRAGFLDAQVRRSPWYHDLPYHLIGSLDVPDRRRWEERLLVRYLAQLKTHGVRNPPTLDEAFDAFRRVIPYGLFIFLINETRFQTEATNTGYTLRFGLAALDHRVEDLYS